nr:MAG TPA: hypothetical protein [Caudoviricetes sp.]DAP51395.1 MAG TPA: hypothetical protein [Caudoviricetes sp.]
MTHNSSHYIIFQHLFSSILYFTSSYITSTYYSKIKWSFRFFA